MNEAIKNYENLEELLKANGEYITTVCGISMWPMLRYRKDPVLIHFACEQLNNYDVALYKLSDKYVLHRILKVQDDCYVIRGDNCIRKEFIPKEDIIGVMAGFWRFGRYIEDSNVLYRLYARVWVAANPLLIRLIRTLKSKSASARRRLKGIRRKP